MCRSDWRWPRLIVPQRCALCVLSKMGEIKETGGGRGDRQRCGEEAAGDMQTKREPTRCVIQPQDGRCEAKESIDH